MTCPVPKAIIHVAQAFKPAWASRRRSPWSARTAAASPRHCHVAQAFRPALPTCNATSAILLVAVLVSGFWASAGVAYAQSGANVLLVVNEASESSLEIGRYYQEKRSVPEGNIVSLSVEVRDDISRADFASEIERPLAAWITHHSAHDRILYLVLIKGIPLRVVGTSGRGGTVASVDSELALLYRKLSGRGVPPQGFIENPYFLGEEPVASAKPFSHQAQDIFLVSRLDGFTKGDVLRLIDHGAAPMRSGQILLDQKESWRPQGNAWLEAAEQRLTEMGLADRVVLDTTGNVLAGHDDVLGYYSWGSNDPAITRRTFDLGFASGALAGMFVSTDARTFEEPPAEWTPGAWDDQNTHFAGSPQSLAGDLIRAGVSGVAGHVAEPYLDAAIRPEILFPAYLSGFNLVEAYYLAMPYLSWQTVVVGDPLCAPFKAAALSDDEIDQGIDPATELPRLFAARKLEQPALAGVAIEAAERFVRGQTRLSKGDRAGARAAFAEAATLDESLNPAHLALAALFEESQDYDGAIEHYRRALENAQDDAGVLNNLAYTLAEHGGEPDEALPLARKAYLLANGHPVVSDTLGWIHHLRGDDTQALPLLVTAARGAAANVEIRLHAAIVHAAVGEEDDARSELAAALELDPSLAARKAVIELQAQLNAASGL